MRPNKNLVGVCHGDGRIERLAESYSDFRIVLHRVRNDVCVGILQPEDGVLALSPLTHRQEAQLRNCLERIALGHCALYSINPQ